MLKIKKKQITVLLKIKNNNKNRHYFSDSANLSEYYNEKSHRTYKLKSLDQVELEAISTFKRELIINCSYFI